jgi:hypothetical protein
MNSPLAIPRLLFIDPTFPRTEGESSWLFSIIFTREYPLLWLDDDAWEFPIGYWLQELVPIFGGGVGGSALSS